VTAPDEYPLTPDLSNWAKRQFSEEEIVAGLDEIEAAGGLQSDDFIHEIEQELMPPE
jgi:hypothetical protein